MLREMARKADDLAAQRHAIDQFENSYYDHRDLEGGTARDRAARAGYRSARTVAENIAKGPFSPREVVQRWMKSRGHRKNILGTRIRAMGVGVAFGENDRGFEVLWVQVFAG